MSTPREFYVDPKLQQVFSNRPFSSDYVRFIPVIEKTPEVVRKLEFFDELVDSAYLLLELLNSQDRQQFILIDKTERLIKKAKGE
jgi:hypothetical protein